MNLLHKQQHCSELNTNCAATPDNKFISLVATIPLDNAFFNKLYKIHLKIAVVLHSNLILDCTLIGDATGISEPKVFQFGTHFHVLSLQLPFALSLTFYQYSRGFMFLSSFVVAVMENYSKEIFLVSFLPAFSVT